MLKAFIHAVHAARHSMAGLGYLLRNELAARIEVVVIGLSFLWFFALNRSFVDFLILAILACIVLSVEALNTAIEVVVDRMSPQHSDFAKAAKDLGSAAVFFLLVAGGLLVVSVTADALGLASL